MTIDACRIIELPKFLDERGNLSFAENFAQIPFEIKRTYWLYDVPGGVERGGHAEMRNEELVIALSGAFEIVVDDGCRRKSFVLNRSYFGLYIPKGLWREIREFSTNAVALEFGSIPYDVNDYIRDYETFLAFSKSEMPVLKSDENLTNKPIKASTNSLIPLSPTTLPTKTKVNVLSLLIDATISITSGRRE